MLIPPHVFAVGNAAAKPADKKPKFTGVYLERDGAGEAVATASDGCKLLSVRWPEGDGGEFPTAGLDGDLSAAPRDGYFTFIPVAAWNEMGQAAARVREAGNPVLQNLLIDEHREGCVKAACTDLEKSRVITSRVEPMARLPWEAAIPLYQLVGFAGGAADMRAVQFTMSPKLLISLLESVVKVNGPDQPVFLQVPFDVRKALVVKGVGADGTTTVAAQMPRFVDGDLNLKDATEALEGAVADTFTVVNRTIGNVEHWVVVDGTGRPIAQQPIQIEFLSDEAKEYVRVSVATGGGDADGDGEMLAETLNESAVPADDGAEKIARKRRPRKKKAAADAESAS